LIKKLPYKLTDGAFATKDGLVVVMLARSPFLEMKDDAFRCNGIENLSFHVKEVSCLF